MRNLIALPIIFLAVILQTSVVSRITLLSGYADLPLVLIAAWALQEQVDTAWHWAIATGILVGFISGINWVVPVLGYVAVVGLAKILQLRVWQAPLLAMFSISFLGTLVLDGFVYVALRLSGVSIPFQDAFGLQTLPRILLNLLFSIPVYAVLRDLAYWTYSSREAE
jgi:dolichyl-phosphate-mannose--protein O-mannosyl transferase